MIAPAIRVDGLWEAYNSRNRIGRRQRGGELWALRDISFTVEPSRSLGLVGGNGSGKTTLLQVLTGVLQPTRGVVEITGRRSSLIELSAGFHRDLTGHENLQIGGVLLGMTRREIRARYDDIVAFSGLPPAALDRRLAGYSAGMGLRLGFSLVAHSAPDVLLVDEVLAVGDATFQARCIERVEELQREGCAVVIASHDLELVRAHCGEVAVLDAGELRHLGDTETGLATYLRLRDEADERPPEELQLYASSSRVQAARRRKGV